MIDSAVAAAPLAPPVSAPDTTVSSNAAVSPKPIATGEAGWAANSNSGQLPNSDSAPRQDLNADCSQVPDSNAGYRRRERRTYCHLDDW